MAANNSDDNVIEAELVARAQGGDPVAFAGLCDRLNKPIYRIAFRMLRNEWEAEDLTQDCLFQMFRKLRQYTPRPGISFRAWVMRIAINLGITKLRKRVRIISLDEPAIGEVPDCRAQVERVLAAQFRRDERSKGAHDTVKDCLMECLERLADDRRDAVSHRYLGEMTIEEICSLLNKSRDAIYQDLTRGRASLKTCIEKNCPELRITQSAKGEM